MSEVSSEIISCVLVPLQQHYLILPNASIAETIPMQQIEQDADKPDYWLGNYMWQSTMIPVINLDRLIEGVGSESIRANKLCMIRTVNTESNIPAYALPTNGAPQLIQLSEKALNVIHDVEHSEFIHCQIKVGNKAAIIPNLDAIEEAIRIFL